MERSHTRWVLPLVLSCMLLGSGAVSAVAEGNSENAKRCQHGGWETLAREESPAVPFASQGDCVRYGAQGGTIVDQVTTRVVVSRIRGDGDSPCTDTFTLVDAPAGLPVLVTVTNNRGGLAAVTLILPTDPSFNTNLFYGGIYVSGTAEVLDSSGAPTGTFVPIEVPTAPCGA